MFQICFEQHKHILREGGFNEVEESFEYNKIMNSVPKQYIMNVHAKKIQMVGESLNRGLGSSISEYLLEPNETVETVNLLNTEKFDGLVEFYEKEDLPHECDCQELNKTDQQEAMDMAISQVKCESDNCENVAMPTSCSCENDTAIFPENESPSSFTCSHANFEFEHTVEHEDDESFEVVNDKPSQYTISTRTNDEVYDSSDAFVDDLKDTKELNQDTQWETELPNFSPKSNVIESCSPVPEEQPLALVSKQEDCEMDIISTEDPASGDAEHVAEENSVDTNALRELPLSLGSKLCNRLWRKNTNVEVTEVHLDTDKYPSKVSNNILVKPSANTQPSELTEEQLNATVEENIPPKKRRLMSSLSPRSQRNVCKTPNNQQKLLKKHNVPAKKGWIDMWYRESQCL